MKITNNYGRTITCTVCGSENLHEYRTYTPPFASAIDSVYIGWCIEHKGEGLNHYNKCVGSKDRINQAGSNS